MRLIVVESPFMGDTNANLAYLRFAMRFCLIELGASPYASHGLYTQPGVLRDDLPDERRLGMRAGFSWGKLAEERGVFCDRGISGGMVTGIKQARRHGQVVRYYQIRDWIDCSESPHRREAMRNMPSPRAIERQIAECKGAYR